MRAIRAVVCSLLLSSPLAAQQPDVSAGGLIGYQRGLGVESFATVSHFAEGLPISVRLRIGRTATDPGDPTAARRIFINTATNGTPVESGRTWNGALDVLVPRGPHHRLWAGIRYTHFLANFKFIGGNEDFDVRSSIWGLSAGADLIYGVSPRMDLIISGGLEAYRSSRLQGHDTSYSPNGQNVNPREDFTYRDADRAINQPRLRPTIMVGLSRKLGR